MTSAAAPAPTPAERSRLLAASEQVTLWTLGAAASLYTVGQISHLYKLRDLGIFALRAEVPWQDRVFEGGIAVINIVASALFAFRPAHLSWVGVLLAFGLSLRARRWAARRPRLRLAATILAGVFYVVLLVVIGMIWGKLAAEHIQKDPRLVEDHFVFTADAAARLPPPLREDNERHALLLLDTTPEFFVVLSGDGKSIYRIAVRDVEFEDSKPHASARAAQPAGKP